MTAVRTVRSTAYGARLFAYVLAVAAVGGGLLGAGYSLAWPTVIDVVLRGASVESPATLVAGSALGLVGVCVLGTGLFATLHNLVADGVARGVESAAATADGATPTGDTDRAGGAAAPGSGPDSGRAAGPDEASLGAGASADGTDRTATAPAADTGPPGSGSEPVTGEAPEAADTHNRLAATPDHPDQGDAVPGVADADGGDDEWMSPDDLETEPVDVGTSDTVPVDGGAEPDPGDGSGEDTEAADRPPEPSPEEIAFGSTGDRGQSGQRGVTDTESEGGTVTERSDWFGDDTDGESDTGTTEEERAEEAGVEPAGSTAVSDPLADPNEPE